MSGVSDRASVILANLEQTEPRLLALIRTRISNPGTKQLSLTAIEATLRDPRSTLPQLVSAVQTLIDFAEGE